MHAVCGNGIRFAGDVVTQRFTLNCADWKDDGFDPPSNSTGEDEGKEDDGDKKKASSSLYYKFMLRKNGITVPIAEGGQLELCG